MQEFSWNGGINRLVFFLLGGFIWRVFCGYWEGFSGISHKNPFQMKLDGWAQSEFVVVEWMEGQITPFSSSASASTDTNDTWIGL